MTPQGRPGQAWVIPTKTGKATQTLMISTFHEQHGQNGHMGYMCINPNNMDKSDESTDIRYNPTQPTHI